MDELQSVVKWTGCYFLFCWLRVNPWNRLINYKDSVIELLSLRLYTGIYLWISGQEGDRQVLR